ncbi:serine/threonine-protein kinase [Allokutzneria albata]|uniref:Serine/threonine protein kinase n=1 Tax=Allokutzneria albata TaxID=211114 RepID=A0A1G9TY43_ALLAB|nr:serine/threonine-protein kinase [Allokutzneria albata]SDM52513.1 Serine/threonine protein kinase [Allokutzneria albata]
MSLTTLDGRYELGMLLGQGGMADVFRAVDTVLGRDVAVKIFRGGSGSVDRARFLAECHLSAGLHHPNLVTVYDAGTDNGRDYLVMRLIEGKTLADKLDWGALEASWVCEVGAVVAQALAHVHASGVVHRDIKPSNILLGQGEVPYLADFGIALPSGARRLTKGGQFLGTIAYTAPEQIQGAQATAAADVYAFGLVLLEALTGRVEFDGPESAAAVAKLNRAPEIPDTIPDGVAAVLKAMLSEDPARRPTAASCAELLRAAAAGEAPEVTIPPVTTPEPITERITERITRRRRVRPAYLVAGGAAIAAAVLLFPASVLDAGSPRSENGKAGEPTTTTVPPQAPPAVPSTRPLQPAPPGPPITGQPPAPITREVVLVPQPQPQQPKDRKPPKNPPDNGGKGGDGGGKRPGPGDKGGPGREP